ncbi:unnamed protein product [Paramecium sonneborni]|uniref:Uncharacterized protein n=1 Tax=Paramecium sonneborni TaxID=65129 RepID=A0A8S1PTG2_9CILI|nr:unnamed protein product [Paramecium sonneborni]
MRQLISILHQFSDINYFFEQSVFIQNLIPKKFQETFKELGLILEQPRSAMVMVAVLVEQAQVNASFNKVISLQSAQVSSLNKRLQFLYEHFLPFLKNQQQHNMFMIQKIQFYKRKDHLILNKNLDCIYIIYKGELEGYKVKEIKASLFFERELVIFLAQMNIKYKENTIYSNSCFRISNMRVYNKYFSNIHQKNQNFKRLNKKNNECQIKN